MQLHEFAPKIVVVGVGGAGTNAVNNMVASGLSGEISILCFSLFYIFFYCYPCIDY
jgi:cell division protein FtsZ